VRVPRLRETLNTHASVEVGINRVYAMLKNCRLIVFSDLEELTEEFESYARVLDDFSRPTEEIADKGDYHLMDATRYVCSELSDTSEARAVIIGGDNPEMRRQFEEKMKQEAERDQKEKIQEEIHWLLREENWPSWKAWGNQFEEEYR
jgi:hypothetical protein